MLTADKYECVTHLSVLLSLHVVEELWSQTNIEVFPDPLDDLHGDAPLSCGHLLSLEMVEILLDDVINGDLGWKFEQLFLMDHQVPVVHQDVLQLLRNINAILVINFVV